MPAFGEEMNKSRAMVTMQAREFAKQGYQILVPDYFGTGDSAGDFCEASWEIWLEDICYCISWLKEGSQASLILWGLRLGALMALELASDKELGVSALLLWNPVLSGEQHMLQFLRLRLANSMMNAGAKEKMGDLKALLEKEGMLEVAGYELPCALFNEVCARKAIEIGMPSVKAVYWAELSPSAKVLSGPAQQLVDRWKDAGLSVETEQIVGPQFWATQEISEAFELIEKTSCWLEKVALTPTLSQRERG